MSFNATNAEILCSLYASERYCFLCCFIISIIMHDAQLIHVVALYIYVYISSWQKE
jgi:hypothetical protein